MTTEPTTPPAGAAGGDQQTGRGEPAKAPEPIKNELGAKGVYMVLKAAVPENGDDRPRYEEVGYYRATGPNTAKRRAAKEDAELRAQLRTSRLYLRAVPAQSWPDDVVASGFRRPEPRLEVH